MSLLKAFSWDSRSFLLVFLTLAINSEKLTGQGAVTLEISDSDSGAPIAARVVFAKSPKKVVRPKKLLFAGPNWLVEEPVPLSLPNGEYEFTVKRGPEFKEIRGGFTIEPRAKDIVSVEVPRAVDMHSEKWFSGDHLSSLPIDTLKRWQMSDAIDMAISVANSSTSESTKAPTSKSNNSKKGRKNRDDDEDLQGGDETQRLGFKLNSKSERLDWSQGSILIHPLSIGATSVANPANSNEQIPPIDPAKDTISIVKQIEQAKAERSGIVELLRPWQRDVPFLLASEAISAVQILSESNRPFLDDRIDFDKGTADGFINAKVTIAKGKERQDATLFAPIRSDEDLRFRDARGVGILNEFLYWQMLEAGFRIPPTAGSCFGTNDTLLGYNRVYVYSEEPPTNTTWWTAIQKGQTTVTNGPLLRTLVNGLPPGSVQASYRGQPISIDIAVSLSVREPVDYLDVIFNGETMYSAKLDEHYKRGEFPPMDIEQSGWLVVRVVTAHEKGYRLATTAPFYFEFDNRPRINRKAVEFFQTWLEKAIAAADENEGQSPAFQSLVKSARQFWSGKLAISNGN